MATLRPGAITATCLRLAQRSTGRIGLYNLQQRRGLATRQTRHQLNTGASIPAIGFGTFQDPDAQEDAVSRALKAGLRLIDTARVYDVEKQVGQGIKRSGVPREEIFLGTKLWCNNYHPDDVERALDESLTDLDTPYVDLLLMHYPCTFARGEDRFPRDSNGKMILGQTSFVDTWRAMEKLVETGKVKSIGVSNFSRGELETLMRESATVSPTWRATEKEARKLCRRKSADQIARYLLFIKWKCILTCSKSPLTSGFGLRASM